MLDNMYLILENGDIFEGRSFGYDSEAIGEVAFTTAMTGYLETLTDKSYCGQIILQAFPLIGNYGVIPEDFEGQAVHASGYIVSDWCRSPSNFRSEGTVDAFLKANKIPGIYALDTRRVIKTIREQGAMNAKLSRTPDLDLTVKNYKVAKAVERVTSSDIRIENEGGRLSVALFDFGYKENILRELVRRDCRVTVFPAYSCAEEIIAIHPDGVMLSNGPGNPADNPGIIKELKKLAGSGAVMFGICLGHQLLALANGFSTHKLKFGHRGANHPAKNLLSGRTYITSQNHGYAVVRDSIDKLAADELFINVNDLSNEGIVYKNINAFSVQFHPEGCGGPQDTNFLFGEFIERMEAAKNA